MNVPAIFALLAAHKLVVVIVAWLLFSAAVDGMPKPDAGSSLAYRWLSASLNLLAANVFRVLAALYPRFAKVLETDHEDG